MSNKLKNIAQKWDTIEELSDGFAKLEVGPHIVKITDVENFDDKEYLKVYFDINEGELKGEFARRHEQFGPDWPYDATVYASYKQTALSFFRRFITAVERSNSGYSFVNTNGDFELLKGKLVVAVYGLTEIPVPDSNNNNKPQVAVKFREWRSIEALREGLIETPEDIKKLTSNYDLERYQEALDEIEYEAPAKVTKQDLSNANIVDDSELPF